MSEVRSDTVEGAAEDGTPVDAVAGGSQWHPLTTAAVIGGAIAATAGAYIGTRAIARRNGRVNSVMATAITACDLAKNAHEPEPNASEIMIAPASRP